jgi:hypothetical protein
MTGELPITLNFVGKKPPPSLKLNANPDFFVKEQVINYGKKSESYIVTSKRLVIDAAGVVTVDRGLSRCPRLFHI